MIEGAKKPRYWAIIPAAGLGLRMGADRPKQYLRVHDKTILSYAVECLASHALIEKVMVVLHADDLYWSEHEFTHGQKIITTIGGDTRAQSVLNGLQQLREFADKADWVCVHDAARPLLTHALVDQLCQQIKGHPVGGLLGVPVSDTLKQTDDQGVVINTLPREKVWQAQTPQCFRYQLLLDALTQALQKGVVITDESSAIEQAGFKPQMVLGDESNIKITRPADLELAQSLLSP